MGGIQIFWVRQAENSWTIGLNPTGGVKLPWLSMCIKKKIIVEFPIHLRQGCSILFLVILNFSGSGTGNATKTNGGVSFGGVKRIAEFAFGMDEVIEPGPAPDDSLGGVFGRIELDTPFPDIAGHIETTVG